MLEFEIHLVCKHYPSVQIAKTISNEFLFLHSICLYVFLPAVNSAHNSSVPKEICEILLEFIMKFSVNKSLLSKAR